MPQFSPATRAKAQGCFAALACVLTYGLGGFLQYGERSISFAVTGRTGDTPKPIYSIAQSNEQGEFGVYDGSGSIVCAITASNFEDKQAVIDFLFVWCVRLLGGAGSK